MWVDGGERETLLLSTAFNVELQSKRFISIGPKVSAKIVQTKKLSAKKVPDRGVLNKKSFSKKIASKVLNRTLPHVWVKNKDTTTMLLLLIAENLCESESYCVSEREREIRCSV